MAGTRARSNWKERTLATPAMTIAITAIRPKMTILEMVVTLSPHTLIFSGSLKKVPASLT